MYDLIKLFHKDIPYPLKNALEKGVKESIIYNGIEFGYDGRKSHIPKFQAKLGNLNIIISAFGSILFNSIHKYSKGYNNNDFTIKEFKQTLEYLSEITRIKWDESTVLKLEAGCNVLESEAEFIFNVLFSYGPKYFLQSNEVHNRGVKCKLTNFDIKVYNKSKETPLIYNPVLNQIRNEINFKRVDKEFPHIICARQLAETETADIIRENLLLKFEKIVPLAMPNLSQLTLREKTILARYKDRYLAESIKLDHPATYKKEISIFREIMAKSDHQIFENYIRKIADKTEELIYS